MNQNKIVAFLMASIVAISIVAIAMPALGSEDKAKEKPAVVIDKPPGSESEPKKPEKLDESKPEVRAPDTYSRDVVIVNFKEMPPSLEEFASQYGGKLIFVKEEIKFAAFVTSERTPMPRPTSQRTLDFIEKVSKDPCVEKAYEDWNIFTSYPTARYTPKVTIIYPEDGLVYIKVLVRFLRLPPSLEEFATRYGATLVEDDSLQYAIFETDDVTGFIRKISTDPYVILAMPTDLGLGYGRIADDPMESAPGVVPDGLTGPYAWPAGPNGPKWNQQRGPKKMDQRRYIIQKLGNTRKAATSIKDNTKVLTAVHRKSSKGGES